VLEIRGYNTKSTRKQALILDQQRPNYYELLLAFPHVRTVGIDGTRIKGWNVWDFAGQVDCYPGRSKGGCATPVQKLFLFAAHEFFMREASGTFLLVCSGQDNDDTVESQLKCTYDDCSVIVD
jgi:hypothetical protein